MIVKFAVAVLAGMFFTVLFALLALGSRRIAASYPEGTELLVTASAKTAELIFACAAVAAAFFYALRIIYFVKCIGMFGRFKKSLSDPDVSCRVPVFVKAVNILCGAVLIICGIAAVISGAGVIPSVLLPTNGAALLTSNAILMKIKE